MSDKAEARCFFMLLGFAVFCSWLYFILVMEPQGRRRPVDPQQMRYIERRN